MLLEFVNPAPSGKAWTGLRFVAAFIVLVLAMPATAGSKKKQNAPAATSSKSQDQKIAFDLSKIVWPNPPAIARIRWTRQFTGEKIDAAAAKKIATKQKWLQHIGGKKPQAQQDLDIPFQLLRPFGLAVDSKGKIYVADQSVGAVFIFNTETAAVEMIRNRHEASFGLIYGLAMDDNDRLFVSDLKLRHVAVFDAKHQQETSFGADVLGRPGGLAVDTENRFLYVVDTEKDVVDVFDADSFKLLRQIGTPGKKHSLSTPGTFSLPSHVAVDQEGNVYVTDTLNDRVEIFDAEGNFISTFGRNGDGPGCFQRPKGIAIDPDGHIWVVDGTQDRVQVFNREGQLLIYFGTHGEWPGMFMAANDICIDKQNRVLVSEQFLGRVQMFRYVSDAEAEKERNRREGKGESAASQKEVAAGSTKNSAGVNPQ